MGIALVKSLTLSSRAFWSGLSRSFLHLDESPCLEILLPNFYNEKARRVTFRLPMRSRIVSESR